MNSASELFESHAGKSVEISSAKAPFVLMVIRIERARAESLFTVSSIANAVAGGCDLYRKPVNSSLTRPELCCVICMTREFFILFCV